MFDGPDARWEAMLHAARQYDTFDVSRWSRIAESSVWARRLRSPCRSKALRNVRKGDLEASKGQLWSRSRTGVGRQIKLDPWRQ